MNEIDNMLEDIYVLDPSLRERDGEVRELVSRLMALKPSVTLDTAFVSELRARILDVSPSPAQETSSALSPIQPTHSWWWFVVRAAPLGAVAVLLLMLVPQTPSSLQDVMTTPYQEEHGGDMTESAMPAAETFETGPVDDAANTRSMKQEMFTTEGEQADESMPVDTFSLMAQPSSSVSAMPQPPGTTAIIESATLEQEGYIAVYADENGALGEFLGVSALLSPGFSESVSVPLSRSMVNNEVFYATIHLDDGDGVFDPAFDGLVFDAAGMPLTALFVASTEMQSE